MGKHNQQRECVKRILTLLCCLSFITSSVGARCVLNPFYVPVCGSDNRTYGNRDLLNCFNQGRPAVRQIRMIAMRECKPLICPSYQDLQGQWIGSTPVCASDGYTYGHIHQIRCLKDFHPNLTIRHEGGCNLHEVKAILGKRNVKRKACAEPRRNFEHNPICMSNNITYPNAFQALCEKPRLREQAGGKCGCPFQLSCKRSREILNSIKGASLEERTKFAVCGSDNTSYRSKEALECSRRFNSQLYAVKYGSCKKLRNACPKSLKHVLQASPICGSDNKSYISYEALLCAKSKMNIGLRYLHAGACIRKT